MADSDLVSLYSGKLLALAANIPLTGRLSDAQASAKRRSAICGSTITADLVLDQGKVASFAQEVRACALGQASAAVLGSVVIGRTPAELRAARGQLAAMLKDAGPVPDAPFDGYEALLPARDYPNRHASIMLALEAALEAAEAAEKQG